MGNRTESVEKLKKVRKSAGSFLKDIFFVFKFMILLFFVFISYLLSTKSDKKKKGKISRLNLKEKLRKRYEKLYVKILKIFDRTSENEVKSSDLILLALKNLSAKKSRTFITIGGMAIGFGSVILLLSLGYGFERLVVNQVATLNEMKQIEVSTAQGSPLSLDFPVMEEICNLEETEILLPVITLVSKVEYNNAVSDILTYAVTTRYIGESRISLLKGELYQDEIDYKGSEKVAGRMEDGILGVSTKLIASESYGEEIYKVRYTIDPLVWKPVYSEPNEDARIVGYTKRGVGQEDAIEVWGGVYSKMDEVDSSVDYLGNKYGRWIKDSFPLWDKGDCSSKEDPLCLNNKYTTKIENTAQVMEVGYLTEDSTSVDRYQLTYYEGSDTEVGQVLDPINFGLKQNFQTDMYFNYSEDSVRLTVLNNSRKDIYKGYLVYGEGYEPVEGEILPYWIKSEIELWSEDLCEGVCDIYYSEEKEGYFSNTLSVYFKLTDVLPEGVDIDALYGDVLGEQDSLGANMLDIETLQKIEDESIDWVEIAEELGGTEDVSVDVKKLSQDSQKVAVVNLAMLELLGIQENEAVGEEFETTFVYDSKLFNKSNYLAESEKVSYKIVGVVSDGKGPAYYIPFNDAMVEGVQSVSSLKVLMKEVKDVADIRGFIEGLGFRTASVTDTVESIGSLFKTLRIGLLVVGLIALAVASLGMFNTLTVSLLEKTREVGLLKTMGMKSEEIKVLFLAESIIMSFLGGLAGVIWGFLVGQGLSFLISVIALSQGQGFINVSYIPWFIVLILMLFSSLVGIFTGWYPAKRAKSISALNALRYE